MKTVETYTTTIYTGLKEGYDGPIHTIEEVKEIGQEYCDRVGFCVTVTPTEFIYKDGNEPGAIIGLINYPRFPNLPASLKNHAYSISNELISRLKQFRLSIVCSDTTIMLENDLLIQK